jgi:hypothetical protein
MFTALLLEFSRDYLVVFLRGLPLWFWMVVGHIFFLTGLVFIWVDYYLYQKDLPTISAYVSDNGGTWLGILLVGACFALGIGLALHFWVKALQ